ncbi:peptide deformylase [Nonomuraea fuscirosea]|uniref:peptide deformylase n=1 Tax=Nonomuraea fuscirosea TaxID=1291556 RepID=UPI0015E64274|nr:peptide deformylase [Nonomuraea fuscirosea]
MSPIVTICPVRGDEQICVPLNQVLIRGTTGGIDEFYSACSCGRRFALSRSAQRRLAELAGDYVAITEAHDTPAARVLDILIEKTTWPAGHTSSLAKSGIVPIGTPVLHAPTEQVRVISRGLFNFGRHMISVMNRAEGIGLAANQVGVPLQVLAHDFGRVVPQIMVNPEILRSKGTWSYGEGCLSLKIEGTAADVVRPKIITAVATLPTSQTIIVQADEILARVLQHEIDHLNGIEYVQRLIGTDQLEVYSKIEGRGINLSCIPPMPYART